MLLARTNRHAEVGGPVWRSERVAELGLGPRWMVEAWSALEANGQQDIGLIGTRQPVVGKEKGLWPIEVALHSCPLLLCWADLVLLLRGLGRLLNLGLLLVVIASAPPTSFPLPLSTATTTCCWLGWLVVGLGSYRLWLLDHECNILSPIVLGTPFFFS